MAERVVVAMSGGVDSSVAAALLLEQGYEVIGIMLRLWSESEEAACYNRCCSPADTDLARRVAAVLGIPFYLLNVAESFKAQVVDVFIQTYLAGQTPNPCLKCNRFIRFGWLLDKALGLGADKLATGHYARTRRSPVGQGESLMGTPVPGVHLLRGLDAHKDQSYVLSLLTQGQLAHVLFPLGELTKPQVRDIARRKGLPVADKPDSQDLCFVVDGDYRRFLMRNTPPGAIRPGPIRDSNGRLIGQHRGLPFYTIGQRRGLDINGPQRLYVLASIPDENTLVAAPFDELRHTACLVRDVNYVSIPRPTQPLVASVRVRYKTEEVEAIITPVGNAAHVSFDRPLCDITPGQAAVFYQGELVLGGGLIAASI